LTVWVNLVNYPVAEPIMALFTSKVEYALRAVVDLAARSGYGAIQSREIAVRQGIPESYLDQLLSALRRAGLVRSIRGASGGYTLGRPAHLITVGDVIRAFDGTQLTADSSRAPAGAAPAGDRGTAAAVLGVRRRVQEAIREVIEQTTIRDLVVEKQRLDETQSLMAGI
jgi:Rrf2 family transcriptional regulator, cysteine metabolism repressor